jgi:hypothetical protein
MKYVTIKMTRDDALKLGLLCCSCGHAPDNHYDDEVGSCFFCYDCKKYNEEPKRGKIIKVKRKKK